MFPNARPNDAPKWVWSQNGITLGKYLVWAHVQLGTTLGTSIGTFWAVIWASLHRNVRKLSFCVNLFDLLWFFKEYYYHELLYGLVLDVITPYQRGVFLEPWFPIVFRRSCTLIVSDRTLRKHITGTHYKIKKNIFWKMRPFGRLQSFRMQVLDEWFRRHSRRSLRFWSPS